MSYHGPINFDIEIPREVLYSILINLSVDDIEIFCGANTELSFVCKDPAFWKLKVTTDYPSVVQPVKNWRHTAHILRPKTISVTESISYIDRGHLTHEDSHSYELNLSPVDDFDSLMTELYIHIKYSGQDWSAYFVIGDKTYEYEFGPEIEDFALVEYDLDSNIRGKSYSFVDSLRLPLYLLQIGDENFYQNLTRIFEDSIDF